MKMLRIIMILLGALLLANCSGDFEQETGIVPSHSGQVSFLFGLQQDDASVVQTRGSKPEQITRMCISAEIRLRCRIQWSWNVL